MSFWEELKQALIGAESPSTSYQMYDLKRKQEERELKLASNPAGKNIVIPAEYLRYGKKGLEDGNFVDDYILDKYFEGIPHRGYLMPETNVVANPITGLASGLGRALTSSWKVNEYIQSSYYPRNRSYSKYYRGPLEFFSQDDYYLLIDPNFDANRTLSVNNTILPDTGETPVVPLYKPQPEVLQAPAKESSNDRRTVYNQARGITTADAYAKQKELRNAGYNITYDGYWGDASAAAWEDYMQTKAANMTPKIETPSLAVAPSVTKPVTTPKATDPNSPEANRQRFLNEQAAKIATAKMPPLFANIDIMGAIKAEEARKKAELEALMQQQVAGSKLLNTDPHNIQGGYVVPIEPEYDMSKMDTHNQFGLKFQQGGNIGSNNISLNNYKGSPNINNRSMIDNINPFYGLYESGGMIPKHQNASGEKLEEKPKMISISGPNYNETMVEGTDSTGTNKYQFREIEQQGDTTKVLYIRDPKTGQIVAVPADSRFNKDFEWMIRNAEPINEYKKGGSLKKCSCGCKTLLKRGKGGKVIESKNCK